jgi:hypothetical protein
MSLAKRATGRSATTSSRSAQVASIIDARQLNPQIPGSSGCAAAYSATFRCTSSTSSCSSNTSPVTQADSNSRWMWDSMNPGSTRRPPASTTRVSWPTIPRASRSSPTKTIVSPRTARALTTVSSASIVSAVEHHDVGRLHSMQADLGTLAGHVGRETPEVRIPAPWLPKVAVPVDVSAPAGPCVNRASAARRVARRRRLGLGRVWLRRGRYPDTRRQWRQTLICVGFRADDGATPDMLAASRAEMPSCSRNKQPRLTLLARAHTVQAT